MFGIIMSFKSVIRLLLFCLCVDLAHQTNFTHWQTHITTEKTWDYMVLTQSWPTTVCKDWTKDGDNSETCLFPKGNIWTIHGLWPHRIDNKYPINCNTSWLFDAEQLVPIEKELNFRWKNVKNGTGIYDLWAHEWQKHGTCAASVEPLNTQLKYFKTCLQLHKQYPIAKYLREANIYPSNIKPVTVQEIYRAVVSKIGTTISIQCRFENGHQYLYEIRICLNKDFNLMDCDMFRNSDDKLYTNCDQNMKIIYTEQPKG